MPSRFTRQKPDPAIKRNVQLARARMQDTKGETAVVATASLGATICAWFLLATLGSPAAAGTQVANINQNVANISAQAPAASISGPAASTGIVQVVGSTSQFTPASNAAVIQAPLAVAVTRSSR